MTLNTRMVVYYRKEWSSVGKGPNTLPCGTPYSNKLGYDLSSEVTTIWDRPERNEDSKFKAVDEKPNHCCKRWRRILWSIVSKAAEKSRRRSAEERPASSETKISFWTRRRAVSQKWNLRYADWNFDIKLWAKRCNKRLWKWHLRLALTGMTNLKWDDNSLNLLNPDLVFLGKVFFQKLI